MYKNNFVFQAERFIDKIKDPKIHHRMGKGLKHLNYLQINTLKNLLRYIEKTHGDSDARDTALWLCGELKKKNLASALAENFRHEKDKIWLFELAKVLMEINSKKSVEILIDITLNDTNNIRREAAAYALSFIRDRKAAKAFIKIVKNEKENIDLKAQAIEGLAYYFEFRKKNNTVLGILRRLLKHKNVKIRFWTVFAIATLKDKKSISRLKELTRKDNSVCPGWWSIKKEAKSAIHKIETGNWPD